MNIDTKTQTITQGDITYEWRGWLGAVWLSIEGWPVPVGSVRVIGNAVCYASDCAKPRRLWDYRVTWVLVAGSTPITMDEIRALGAKVFNL